MKTFKDFNSINLTVERNGAKLSLARVQQGKGTKGYYPGLTTDTFDMGVFIEWIGGDDKFTKWLTECFNTDSQLLWKDASESLNLEKESTVTPEQVKALEAKYSEYLIAMFDGRRSKDRDASSIAVEIGKTKKEFTKLVAAKGDAAKITELRAKLVALSAEYKEAVAREQEAILLDLEMDTTTAKAA